VTEQEWMVIIEGLCSVYHWSFREALWGVTFPQAIRMLDLNRQRHEPASSSAGRATSAAEAEMWRRASQPVSLDLLTAAFRS